LITFVSIFSIKRGIETKNDLDISNTLIVQLEDSVANLNNKILSLANKIENQSAQNKYVKYTVKKGDSPWKIAELFYGDGRKYVLIEKENNLIQPFNLQVGQVLLIKMPE
jgi:nucleoid-associated protein YgaU